jgi:hypothetical protein
VGASAKEDRKAAIKAELTRLGQLCSTLELDEEAFSSLFSGGSAPLVQDVGDGIYYQPVPSLVCSARGPTSGLQGRGLQGAFQQRSLLGLPESEWKLELRILDQRPVTLATPPRTTAA